LVSLIETNLYVWGVDMDFGLFLCILGLGTSIPFTLVIIINLIIKVREGDRYQLNIISLGKVYLVALLGWALFFSTLTGR
jgi:hypothetical protein